MKTFSFVDSSAYAAHPFMSMMGLKKQKEKILNLLVEKGILQLQVIESKKGGEKISGQSLKYRQFSTTFI